MTAEHDRDDTASTEVELLEAEYKARWPMAGAVVAAMALTGLLPSDVRAGPGWLLPLVEGVLLVALVASDPGTISRRSRALRGLSIVLVAVLVFSALWGTAFLIEDLIEGSAVTNSASDLLEAATVVWVSNTIAFALLYWELDGGGAAARAHGALGTASFAFPQQINPHLARPGWRPQFVDYLYLGLTNATAFSPTDTMPLAPWAKLAMSVQALISFALLGLVVARAVNVLA